MTVLSLLLIIIIIIIVVVVVVVYYLLSTMLGAFRVLTDTYVTSSEGTGVVHQAPGFGEDDYRICLANQVFQKNEAVLCPVDESGLFTGEVTDYAGIYVKVHKCLCCVPLFGSNQGWVQL